jgi:hypothetical protein
LLVLVTYWLVLGAYRFWFMDSNEPVRIAPPDGNVALVIVPFTNGFMYLLAVFSFGLAGDLAGRSSIFPTRLFSLPISTAALAGWPMLYGSAAVAALWWATVAFAKWPWGFDLPLIWPALLAAVFLAWTQVLMWMPYGFRGVRVIVTVLWLMTLDAAVILAFNYETPAWVMASLLAPQLPLAYLAACVAVAKARRGHVPDWRWWSRERSHVATATRAKPFSVPGRAQVWFEWRQHGRVLPVLVAMVIPFLLALAAMPGNDTPTFVMLTLIVCVLMPPFLAGFVATSVSRPASDARETYGLAPFMAVRPVTSAQMVAAKLEMAMWSTLATWLLLLVAIPAGLILSGTGGIVVDEWRGAVGFFGQSRAIAIALLVVSSLVTGTWSLLVQGLFIGLTGRRWLIRSSVVLALALMTLLIPAAQRIVAWRPDVLAALWENWPRLVAVLVGLKMFAATWIAHRLVQQRLISDRTLIAGAAGWMLAVLAIYAVLVWIADTTLIPRYPMALLAILAVPLARVSAAPLALAWNRHR